MTRKLSAESAKRMLSEVAGKPHRFALCCVADGGLTGDPLHGRPECSIEVAGWFLVPFVDGGDWDYVDRVVSPDGDVYDVDPQEIPADLDDDARNAHVIWQVFNLYPETGAPAGFKCPCGYRQGFCWATAKSGR